MSQIINRRERITQKDIQNIMGYKRTKAFLYYKQLKARKKERDTKSFDNQTIFVDDLAEYSGLSREVIKAALVD